MVELCTYQYSVREKTTVIIHVQILLDALARPVRHRAESRDEGLDVLGGGTRRPRAGDVMPSSLRGCPARPHPRTSLLLPYCMATRHERRNQARERCKDKKEKRTADCDDAAGVARLLLRAERRVSASRCRAVACAKRFRASGPRGRKKF